MALHIRHYSDADVSALAEIYRQSVMCTGRSAYSDRQVQSWASYVQDSDAFAQRLRSGVTLVAEIDAVAAGFGQLDPLNHVSLLFTAPHYARRGIASAILPRLEQCALEAGATALHTEASLIARPLFERHGFEIIEKELAEFQGMRFERFRMRKALTGAANDGA